MTSGSFAATTSTASRDISAITLPKIVVPSPTTFQDLPAAVPAGAKAEAEAKRAKRAKIWRIMVTSLLLLGGKCRSTGVLTADVGSLPQVRLRSYHLNLREAACHLQAEAGQTTEGPEARVISVMTSHTNIYIYMCVFVILSVPIHIEYLSVPSTYSYVELLTVRLKTLI
jgi:hypothetical protein